MVPPQPPSFTLAQHQNTRIKTSLSTTSNITSQRLPIYPSQSHKSGDQENMSTSSFLLKMRKPQLEQLSSELGLDGEGLRKTQLEVLIDEHLTRHPELSTDARVAQFYKRRTTTTSTTTTFESPVKREPAVTIPNEIPKVAKTARRRVTKAAEDIANSVDESEPEQAASRARNAIARTPARVQSLTSQVPLPASPSVVADAIERGTAVMRHKVSDAVQNSGVVEAAQSTRESLSTVVSIEALTLLFEAYNLRPEILEDRYAFTIPTIPFLLNAPHPVSFPDLFLLLTARFWQPALLWAATSFFVPLFFSYFFNLTNRPSRNHARFRYTFDPLTFNIVKTLMTYAVYAQDVTFGGLVDLESVARIRSASAGGWQGIVAGAGIGILVTFYEAIIRK